ncbi:MAG: MarR family transcriptional regulator [Parvularculaceae bacterium]
MNDFAAELGPGYLNLPLRRLAQRLAAEGDIYLQRTGVNVSARATAILAYIARNEQTPIVHIAEALGYTHPAVAKAVEKLEQDGIVQSRSNKEDLRRRYVSLTRKGKQEMRKIDEVARHASAVFEDIFEEIGVDLFDAILEFERALDRRPLVGRMEDETR